MKRSTVLNEKIRWTGHFSKIGWTQERDAYELLWFPEHKLEALRLESGKLKIAYAVSNDARTEMMPGADKAAGTTGKGMPLYYVRLWSDDADWHVYYRVCLKHIGWTAFSRDGEICGSRTDDRDCFIEGIQLFILDSTEKLGDAVDLCEKKRLEYLAIKNRLFIQQADKALLALTHSHLNESASQVQEISEGYLLPLRKTAVESRSGIYEGGVVDSNLRFIAGLERKKGQVVNYTCMQGYEFKKEDADKSDETVIFGGIFISTFGHLFAECLSRLWWVIRHRENQQKVVLLGIPGQKKFAEDFFELLGIAKERIWRIEKPTRFRKIIVPEQSVRLLSDYKKEYLTVYDEIRSRVKAKDYEKIYLTRRKFAAQDGINEEFFENFYGNRGYKIIAPEQFTIKEQVEIMAGAEEVVCTQGTLSHLALFCGPGTKLTIIRRTENVLRQQILIDQARQLEVTYIDATFNFMPASHAGGVFLYGPTVQFVEYLKRNGFVYRQEEIDFHIEDYVYEYLMRWCKNYNEVKNFHTISGWDMFDVLSNMNHVFGLPAISRKNYSGKVLK